MTVLRSREVLSTVASKASQPQAAENAVFEPATPCKMFESLSQSLDCSTSVSSSPAENSGNLVPSGLRSGGGSVMVVESAGQPRRSARLSLKVGANGYVGSAGIVNGKRKRKVEGSALNGENVASNLGGQGLDLKLGVESSNEVLETGVNGEDLKNLDDIGSIDLATDREGIRNEGRIASSGLDRNMKTGGLETVNNWRLKRKFNMEVKSMTFESNEKGEVEQGYLSLRSGKKVVKGDQKNHNGSDNGIGDIEDSKKICAVLSGDDLVKSSSEEESMEELKNDSIQENGFSGEEEAKAKGKAICETNEMSGSVSVNCEQVPMDVPEHTDSKLIIKGEGSKVTEMGVTTKGKMSKEEKGKMKLLRRRDSSPKGNTIAESKSKRTYGSSSSGASPSAANETLQGSVQVREADVTAYNGRAYMERFRSIAKRNASRFAHFSSRDELGNHSLPGREAPPPETNDNVEDWPGPFSTAMKIIKDRGTNKHGQRGSSSDKTEAVELKWIPKKQESVRCMKQAPSLQELCLSILSKNADAISSLDFVPDALRHKICWFLCDGRKMDSHFLKLLVQGSPTEIRVRDCSWLSEELFAETFDSCDTSKLMVLQLDQGGSCMPDYTLHSILARSPDNMPALTTISLKAAYRLTDAGLSMLVSSAPSLKSIDVSQCPLLTAEGIYTLENSLRSIVRELYLDECQGIDAMLMLPALLNLECLEVISLAGIPTVCDDFVSAFVSAHGSRIKELGLAHCTELTDLSVKAIAENCSELRAIDLSNLSKLTDVSIGHLANGCQGIQTLKLCRNRFSDEAIAAYLNLRGAFLKDLYLNNVVQVSNHTALSLARNCRNLRSLDLSWCRNLTNEALGLIVDSCLLLELLKMFGCTQVTEVFLNGHSNSQVKILGLKMSPILKHIDAPDFLIGPLKYSSSCCN